MTTVARLDYRRFPASERGLIDGLRDSLTSLGDRYHGGRVDEVLADWLSEFCYDVASPADEECTEIGAWLDAGYWDAGTASTVAGAYTPSQAVAIAKQQEEAGIAYPSGGLINAHCNSDASLDDYSRHSH